VQIAILFILIVGKYLFLIALVMVPNDRELRNIAVNIVTGWGNEYQLILFK
jgi:hypothetical protein